jgi:ubiquinone/menaquinone biosynthesis C-methylase UbiE
MKLIHKIIDVVCRSSHGRSNINSPEFWDSSLDAMIETYTNMRTDLDLKIDISLIPTFEEISRKRYSKVLEIGCCIGCILKKMQSNFPNVAFYGCDQSKNLIEGGGKKIFKWNHSNGKFIRSICNGFICV